jgi:hypothetical protein
MKLTTKQLKQMIKEELSSLNNEALDVVGERAVDDEGKKNALKREINDKLSQYAFGAGMGTRSVDEFYAALDDAQTTEELQSILDRLNKTTAFLRE